MKQVTTRELRSEWATLINELPFEVIDGKTKKILAVVSQPLPEKTVGGTDISTTPAFNPYSKSAQLGKKK